MPTTYEAIATVTVTGATAASIEFTSIPATYTDLVMVTSTRGNDTSDNGLSLEFNGSTANRTNRRLYGNGSVVASYSGSDIISFTNRSTSGTTNTFDNSQFYFPNYASSNNKSVSIDCVNERNDTNNDMMLAAGLWSNSAAITSIKLVPFAGSFVTHSTATLYGIKNS
jgi:hypothetical protein